jgi:hypothetical protein
VLRVDLSFLDTKMPRLKRRRAQVNVYDLLGLAGSELAADQTLAYFFDPEERHGMGTAMVDALLSLLNGASLLSATGTTTEAFIADAYLEAGGWSVDRQVSAGDPEDGLSTLSWQGVIDIYLTNRELALAIVIENKIGATLNNPLESYVRHALDEEYGTVLLVVLAPYQHSLTEETSRWVSRALTYGALFTSMRAAAERSEGGSVTSDINGQRSIALLEQFQEIRERSGDVQDYTTEAKFVDGFREALEGRQEALSEFFETQKQVNRIYRQRSERLRPLIDERLKQAGLASGWEAHGHQSGHWAYAWNAYELIESANSVELILSPDPLYAGPITAKAYPGRTYKYFPESGHISIGVSWASPDEDVADAFVSFALGVAAAHPTGV